MGEEEWSADLAGIWKSRPRPDRRGMRGHALLSCQRSVLHHLGTLGTLSNVMY